MIIPTNGYLLIRPIKEAEVSSVLSSLPENGFNKIIGRGEVINFGQLEINNFEAGEIVVYKTNENYDVGDGFLIIPEENIIGCQK